jgi:hypothetical protein
VPLNIRQIDSKTDRKKFVSMPWRVYADDKNWVPPLLLDRMEAIDPKKNPFFEHGEAALFLAEENGVPVGRISAHVNHLHNEYHKDKTGFFGFFESINKPDVAKALLEAAQSWLKARNCDQVIGPESFSTNEEIGLLVKGFEETSMIMCPYNPPYYATLMESAGYQKAKNLFGWHYDMGEIPDAPKQVAEAVEQVPGLVVRTVDRKHWDRDIHIVMDIFNAAWNKNWGYVPWTEHEIQHAAQMLKMILKEDLTAIAEVDGKPAGMMLAFPNINEIIKDLDGHLFPMGIFKLLYRLRFHKFKTGRLMLLGIRPEFRGSVLGGLSVLLYIHAHRGGLKLGFKSGELGWTLEDNEKINAGIQFMGGRIGKVYRIYGKTL